MNFSRNKTKLEPSTDGNTRQFYAKARRNLIEHKNQSGVINDPLFVTYNELHNIENDYSLSKCS